MPNASKPGGWMRFLYWTALVLVPLAVLNVWLLVRRPDCMSSVYNRYYLSALVYDEYDYSAMALRGLNADRDRLAGEPIVPGSVRRTPEEFATLKPRYFLEYPHAALLLFRIGFLIQPKSHDVPLPPFIGDGDYHLLAEFVPTEPEHVELVQAIITASNFYMATMVVCWFLLMLVLHWGYGKDTQLQGGALLLLMPAMLYFTFNRFDVIPTLLTALSLACLGRRWRTASAVFLALAVLVKVFPVLLAPLIVRYLWRDRRDAIFWCAVFGATGMLAFTPMLFGADLTAVLAPYRYQFTREPEYALTLYGLVIPKFLGAGTLGTIFRLGSVLGVLTLMLVHPIRDLASVLRRGALVLLVTMTVAVFYSPQWILWFAPLIVPLVRHDRRLGRTLVIFDLLTYLTFPVWFWALGQIFHQHFDPEVGKFLHKSMGVLLKLARVGVCGVMAWQLVRAEWPVILGGSRFGRSLPNNVAVLLGKI